MKKLKDSITFIIPTFNLESCSYRLDNFKYIIKKISKVSSNIIVVNQVKRKNENNTVKELSKKFKYKYVEYFSEDGELLKPQLINLGVSLVKTEYFWMNDCDAYMHFDRILETPTYDLNYIQPYSVAKKISEEDTKKLFSGEKIKIEYDKNNILNNIENYLVIYGGFSFICKVSAYYEIGLMDDSLRGWGIEDVEFMYKVLLEHKNKRNQLGHIKILQNNAIHLWHPVSNKRMYSTELYKSKEKYLTSKHKIENMNFMYNSISSFYEHYYKKISIFSLFRTGSTCLGNIISSNYNKPLCNEPFNKLKLINKIEKNPYSYYLKNDIEGYISVVLQNETLIKHIFRNDPIVNDIHPLFFNNDILLFEKIISKSDIVFITTRNDFLDWCISCFLSGYYKSWYGNPYPKEKITYGLEKFKTHFKCWSNWHLIYVNNIINLSKKFNKEVYVLDYEDIINKNEIESTCKKLIGTPVINNGFNIPTKKQKTGRNEEYILNYEEVLNWIKELNIKIS